ncbi:MAG: excisionase family DNA-binding protein [Acidimicrobiales bacterium]
MGDDDILTTTQAAMVLGASRQHVATLADSGLLPSWRAGTHRRFARSDVEDYRRRRSGGGDLAAMNVTDRRSLAFGCLIAAKLVQDPDRVLDRARRNLDQLYEVHGSGRAQAYVGAWDRLLGGPVEGVLRVLTSPDQISVDLRHTSPFAGILSEQERQSVLRALRRVA